MCKIKRFLKYTAIKLVKLSENVCRSVVRHDVCYHLNCKKTLILKT